jgi:predicted ATPase
MRIQNLRIENFRGFRLFRMRDFRRVNLIIGAERSGKTSVLEAIDILMSGGDASVIWSTLYRRGETVWVDREGAKGPGSTRFEIKKLFYDYAIRNLAFFRISADTDRGAMAATARIEGLGPAAEHDLQGADIPHDEGSGEAPRRLMRAIAWWPSP